MKAKDRRIRKMYEILNSIKIIKLNTWEETFMGQVNTIREEEVSYIRRNAVLKACINFVFNSAPILVTLTSFGAYVLQDPAKNILTPDKVRKN